VRDRKHWLMKETNPLSKKIRLVVVNKDGNAVYFDDRTIGFNADIEELPDGTQVLDISEVIDTEAGINMMTCSPTIDASLDEGDVCLAPSVTDQVLNSLPKYERELQVIQNRMREVGLAGPLDAVLPEQYTRNWLDIGGSLGYVRNSKIEWEETECGGKLKP